MKWSRRTKAAADADGLISPDDLRLMYLGAQRRVVALEVQNTSLLARLDQAEADHFYRCSHARQLEETRWLLADARRYIARTARIAEGLLAKAREDTAVIEAVSIADEREPR